MKLLVLHSQLGTLRGGGENFSRNLFHSFAARGHEVQVAFAADVFGGYRFPLPAGVEAMPIRGWWFENLGQATLSAIARRLSWSTTLRAKWDYAQSALAWRTFYWSNRRFHGRVLARLAQQLNDADAVYVHSNAHLARDVAKIRPTVLRLPGPLASEYSGVLCAIHAVCANGDALVRIRTFLGERALELPVGLDEQSFAPGPTSVRATLGWTAHDKVIGFVGRLSHIKGVDLLAESFRLVSAEEPAARMIVIGSGEQLNNVRGTLKDEIARGVVHLAGDVPHEQLPQWYRAMDVLVMPSRYENYSNAILEGLACGVPFIGSDVGGNRALSETGSGWLFEGGSTASLARTMRTVLADAQDRRARGEQGRRYVSGRYSWAATARRLEEIICTLPKTP